MFLLFSSPQLEEGEREEKTPQDSGGLYTRPVVYVHALLWLYEKYNRKVESPRFSRFLIGAVKRRGGIGPSQDIGSLFTSSKPLLLTKVDYSFLPVSSHLR